VVEGGRKREREFFTVWSEIADSLLLEKEATLICVVCVAEKEEIIKINRKIITIKFRQFECCGFEKSDL